MSAYYKTPEFAVDLQSPKMPDDRWLVVLVILASLVLVCLTSHFSR